MKPRAFFPLGSSAMAKSSIDAHGKPTMLSQKPAAQFLHKKDTELDFFKPS